MARVVSSILALLFASLICSVSAYGQEKSDPLIIDRTSTLSSEELRSLTKELEDFRLKTGVRMVVEIVPGMVTDPPDVYAEQTLNTVSRKNPKEPAAVLVLSKTSSGTAIGFAGPPKTRLTSAISDWVSERIISPSVERGEFYAGLSSGIGTMMRLASPRVAEPLGKAPKHFPPAMELLPQAILVAMLGGLILGELVRWLFGTMGAVVVVGLGVLAFNQYHFPAGLAVIGAMAAAGIAAFDIFATSGDSRMYYRGRTLRDKPETFSGGSASGKW